jgi:hypothetical protein
MNNWQSRLEKLVRFGDRLPEPFDIFNARPSSGKPWPKGLPSSPVLADFYVRSDGGQLAGYDWLRLSKLKSETASLRDWLEGVGGGDEAPANYLVLAHDDYGALVWDADQDVVLAYCSNGDCWEETGKSLASFLDDLFAAGRTAGEAAELWASALQWIEQQT